MLFYVAVFGVTLIVVILIMATATSGKTLTDKDIKNIRVTLFVIPCMVTFSAWAVKAIYLEVH